MDTHPASQQQHHYPFNTHSSGTSHTKRRTIVLFAIRPNEKCSAFQWSAGHTQLLHFRDRVRKRCVIFVGSRRGGAVTENGHRGLLFGVNVNGELCWRRPGNENGRSFPPHCSDGNRRHLSRWWPPPSSTVQNDMVSLTQRLIYLEISWTSTAKPQRAPPKAYQVLLKTHRLTIFLTAHQSSTIAKLKEEALSALTSDVLSSSSGVPRIPTAPGEDFDMMDGGEGDGETPRVESTEDFELCRIVKDKGKSTAASSAYAPVSYETLDPATPIKGLFNNWETLYVQFRDEGGMLSLSSNNFCSPSLGNLLPVEVSQPSLLDEEDDEPRRALPAPDSPSAVGKGKRKAPPE